MEEENRTCVREGGRSLLGLYEEHAFEFIIHLSESDFEDSDDDSSSSDSDSDSDSKIYLE